VRDEGEYVIAEPAQTVVPVGKHHQETVDVGVGDGLDVAGHGGGATGDETPEEDVLPGFDDALAQRLSGPVA